MTNSLFMDFTVDKAERTVHVTRQFAAPHDLVWAAWTEAELLDRWWAPAPYQNRTIRMDFRTGGQWHYAMHGPEGDTHYCLADYISVTPRSEFRNLDAFADAAGVINPEWPRSTWQVRFEADADYTTVRVVIRYDDLSDLEKFLEMGFKEGFTQGLNQLAELLTKLQNQ